MLIASEAVLILAVLAVNADEFARLCKLTPLVFPFLLFFYIFHGVRSGGVLLFLVDFLGWHAVMLFLSRWKHGFLF